MNNGISRVACVSCPGYNDLELIRRSVSEAVAAYGGWPDKFIPGARVLLKPNLLSARDPAEAVTTHPEFVRAVVCELRNIGITDITLGDSPAGDYGWDKLWTATGMKSLADSEDIKLLAFDDIRRVEIPGFGVVPLLRQLDEFDAVISLPKLKTHLLTKITAAVKNSYGLMPGLAKSSFHGEYPSPRKMAAFLAAFFNYTKPDFVLLDAIECMTGDGPANGSPYPLGVLMAGSDAVAVDACACRVYGYRASEIPLLRDCAAVGLGRLEDAEIEKAGNGWEVLEGKRLKRSKSDFLHVWPEVLFKPITMFLTCRPQIDPALCVRCGACERACSQQAISHDEKAYRVNSRKCILCMCCIEACAVHAVTLRSPGTRILDSCISCWHKIIPR